MQIDRRRFLGVALVTGVAACTGRMSAPPPQVAAPVPPPAPPVQSAVAAAPVMEPPPLIKQALAALERNVVAARDRMAVVDFSLHSSLPRLHLVDVASGKIEQSLLVAHGSGSDPDHSGNVRLFSNTPGSNASSEGAYLTAERYVGQHGASQRLIGLDPTNNQAYSRAIVVHGADYVAPSLIRQQGRIGRSQGCFALEQHEVLSFMDRLGQGRLIYAAKLV